MLPGTRDDRRIEPSDIDTQLKRIRRDDSVNIPVSQAFFYFPPFRGQ
jgi:hypothetical protein